MLTVLSVAYPFAPVSRDAVGGAEQILSAIDGALVRAGARSLVLACEGSQTAGKLLPLRIPEGPLSDDMRARVGDGLRPAIEKIIAREQVDVVHFHGIGFARSLPRDDDTPVLATLHLPPSWYAPEVFAPRRPNTWLNCVSSSQRRACPPSPIFIEDIGNGVDLARFRPAPARDGYALVLGRLCPEKGIHLAIEAAKWAGVPLVIAGQVFPHPEHVRYFQEQIKPRLDAACFFLGPVTFPRKAELLARARCVVVPSVVAETSSLVSMEALASGTPVVALPKGALPDLIDHGRTGFLVNDVREMRDALLRAGALRAADCRREAEERFGQDRMCARYLAAYERLTSHARGRRAPAVVESAARPRGEVAAGD